MKDIVIDKEYLITKDFEIKFEYKISHVEHLREIYIVLLEIPKGSNEVDNLYGLNEKGKIQWRVQSVQAAYNISENTPYIALQVVGGNKVKVTNFYGMRYTVDILTGELVEKEFIRW